jgi:hypothetical protein
VCLCCLILQPPDDGRDEGLAELGLVANAESVRKYLACQLRWS